MPYKFSITSPHDKDPFQKLLKESLKKTDTLISGFCKSRVIDLNFIVAKAIIEKLYDKRMMLD